MLSDKEGGGHLEKQNSSPPPSKLPLPFPAFTPFPLICVDRAHALMCGNPLAASDPTPF